MQGFHYNHSLRKKIIFTITTLLLMITIGVSQKNNQIMSIGSNALGTMTTPITKIVYFTTSKLTEGFQQIFGSKQLREEYSELVRENKELKEKVGVMEGVINRQDALKEEYELLSKSKISLKRAYISGKEPTNYFIRFNIDKGKVQGIKENDIIVQAVDDQGDIVEGLIGRVYQVGLNFSKISTIIDENSNVSFRVQRTGDIGVISGSADHGINGYMYQHDGDVQVGDKIFTSGLGGIYPRDIYIGEITEVEQEEDGLMKYVKVDSPIDFTKLYRVFIMDQEVPRDESN
ncbi:MAG: rod shape-determining protein MreC [Tissierellia bacterium]|nr:rod shape-determining protein MreC [Tissierellia bacterium]